MDFLGEVFLIELRDLSKFFLSDSVRVVFGNFVGVLIAGVVLSLNVYYIRKILNGANKGKARIR